RRIVRRLRPLPAAPARGAVRSPAAARRARGGGGGGVAAPAAWHEGEELPAPRGQEPGRALSRFDRVLPRRRARRALHGGRPCRSLARRRGDAAAALRAVLRVARRTQTRAGR